MSLVKFHGMPSLAKLSALSKEIDDQEVVVIVGSKIYGFLLADFQHLYQRDTEKYGDEVNFIAYDTGKNLRVLLDLTAPGDFMALGPKSAFVETKRYVPQVKTVYEQQTSYSLEEGRGIRVEGVTFP